MYKLKMYDSQEGVAVSNSDMYISFDSEYCQKHTGCYVTVRLGDIEVHAKLERDSMRKLAVRLIEVAD